MCSILITLTRLSDHLRCKSKREKRFVYSRGLQLHGHVMLYAMYKEFYIKLPFAGDFVL